jgi:preprotein translocase subunit SecG
METFVAILHILVAFVLIALVLVQDSKSGSLGGAFGGGGSNTVFGATGAATLAQKMTRWTAVVFAVTCILLSIFSARSNKSVIDSAPITSSAPATSTAPAAAPEATTTPAATEQPQSAQPQK